MFLSTGMGAGPTDGIKVKQFGAAKENCCA